MSLTILKLCLMSFHWPGCSSFFIVSTFSDLTIRIDPFCWHRLINTYVHLYENGGMLQHVFIRHTLMQPYFLCQSQGLLFQAYMQALIPKSNRILANYGIWTKCPCFAWVPEKHVLTGKLCAQKLSEINCQRHREFWFHWPVEWPRMILLGSFSSLEDSRLSVDKIPCPNRYNRATVLQQSSKGTEFVTDTRTSLGGSKVVLQEFSIHTKRGDEC